MNCGDKIRHARQALSWTHQRLQAESGVHRSRIIGAEDGRIELKWSELVKIAAALKHSTDWFLDGKEPEKQTFLWSPSGTGLGSKSRKETWHASPADSF